MLFLLLSMLAAGGGGVSGQQQGVAPSSIYGTGIDTIYNTHCHQAKYTWWPHQAFRKLKRQQSVLEFNDLYPVPALIMTEEDQMIVTVHNNLTIPITLHWHGRH